MTNWKEDNYPFKKFTEELTQEWINNGFDKKETREWLESGLQHIDASFAQWLRDIKKINAEQILSADDEDLRKEYQQSQKGKKRVANNNEPINAQEWLNMNYPKDQRDKIDVLEIGSNNLEGSLDLREFTNLEVLHCHNNQLTSLDIRGLSKLCQLWCPFNKLASLKLEGCSGLTEVYCGHNLLTDLNFDSLDKQKVKLLDLGDNNFSEQDLSCFKDFVNLKSLFIENYLREDEEVRKGIYNRFYGSLEPLKNLTNLKELVIKNTDIDSGIEFLPETISYFDCSVSKERPESKVKKIEEELKPFYNKLFDYDLKAWKENKGGGSQQRAEKAEEDKQIYYAKLKELRKEASSKQDKVEDLKKKLKESDSSQEKLDLTLKLLELDGEIKQMGSRDKISKHISSFYAYLNEIEPFLNRLKAENINIKDKLGLSPLHIAVACNEQEIAKKLLGYGFSPDTRDPEGNTPLHLAAENNNLEILKLLVEYGEDINAVNDYNWSVLHSAASGIINEKEDWEIIEWMLKQGKINIEIKTKSSFSVRDVFYQKDWTYADHYDKLVENFTKTQQVIIQPERKI